MAQALHRKANRAEIDAVLAKKADLTDLQRVIGALESKIDVTSFESLMRAVETKADRTEMHHHLTQQQRSSQDKANSDVERSFVTQLNTTSLEMERKIADIDRNLGNVRNEGLREMEALRDHVNMNLTNKSDFRDLEKLHEEMRHKADIDRVQNLVHDLR